MIQNRNLVAKWAEQRLWGARCRCFLTVANQSTQTAQIPACNLVKLAYSIDFVISLTLHPDFCKIYMVYWYVVTYFPVT